MVRTNIPTVHVLLVFAAREGENSAATGIFPGLDIPFGITDEPGVTGGIDGFVDRLKRLEDIPDPRFAAMAASGRLAGAIKNLIDPGPGGFDPFKHVRGDLPELGLRVNPFANARLVGDHKNMVAAVRQALERPQRPGQEMKILDLGHVKPVTGKFIDDAIAIKENQFHFFVPAVMPLVISKYFI